MLLSLNRTVLHCLCRSLVIKLVHNNNMLCIILFPQFDALIERLTGRELLTMFARIRGIPEQHIKEVVDTEITRLDLGKHANKLCGKYRYILN